VGTAFQWCNLRERVHLENLSIDRRKILKWILKKLVGREGVDCFCMANVDTSG
jgi:hypothetical protein